MIHFDNTWALPDGETHLQAWMTRVNDRRDGRLRYQGAKYDAALSYCPVHRVAVDVGAHVGLLSYWMARDFATVLAFEPKATHRDCWRANMRSAANAVLFGYALGPRAGRVTLTTGPTSSGDTYVTPGSVDGDVEMRTLDSFSFPIVDFLKLDCEGGEVFVLQGAHATLARCQPVIMVEQKPTHGRKYRVADTAGVALLCDEHGYQVQRTIQGDVILTPGGPR